jgi:hypothetical protein
MPSNSFLVFGGKRGRESSRRIGSINDFCEEFDLKTTVPLDSNCLITSKNFQNNRQGSFKIQRQGVVG